MNKLKAAWLIVGLWAVSSPVLAQNLNDTPAGLEKRSDKPTRPPPAPMVETTLAPLDKSLTALLNDGWTISAANGVWTWTLFKDRRWVFCAVDDGQMSERPASSQCWALN